MFNKQEEKHEIFKKKVKKPKVDLILECPKCGHEFSISPDESQIKCPSCGVEGEI